VDGCVAGYVAVEARPRIRGESQRIRGPSAAPRQALQAGGHRFDPGWLHWVFAKSPGTRRHFLDTFSRRRLPGVAVRQQALAAGTAPRVAVRQQALAAGTAPRVAVRQQALAAGTASLA